MRKNLINQLEINSVENKKNMRTGCKRLKTRIRLRVRLIIKTKNEEYTNKKTRQNQG